MITQEELKSFAHYDPEKGIFIRTKSPCNSVKIGDEIGWQKEHSCGLKYRSTEYKNKIYLMHRLAYLYMTGKFPKEYVDHIDGNGLNNKWSNLREVTRTENLRNRRPNTNNKSGQIGVSFYSRNGKWRAAINVNGGKKHLGYFDTLEEAKAVRLKAQKNIGYHENHGKL